MPTFEKHCEESISKFGKPFEEVHKWLDEFARSKEYGMRHRRKRHHEAGIRQVMEVFGKDAAEIARQHIISDLKEECWKEGDHFPKKN